MQTDRQARLDRRLRHPAQTLAMVLMVVLLGCDKGGPGPSATTCVDASALSVAAATDTALLFGGQPASITFTATAVSYTAPGVSAPVDLPAFYLDREGDGVFEITATSRSETVPFVASGIYPVQVTVPRCDGGVLVARAEVAAISVSTPTVFVAFDPNIGSPVRVGTPITVLFEIRGGTNNPPFTLTWDWGDGATGFTSSGDQNPKLTRSHTYLEPGVFSFSATVRDRHGLKNELTRTILSTVPTGNVFTMDFGDTPRNFDLFFPNSPTRTTGPVAALASGTPGLVQAQVGQSAVTFVSRTDPAFPQSEDFDLVAVDDDNDVIYVANRQRVYIYDGRSPYFPVLLTPAPFPPPSGFGNIDRMQMCGGRLMFHNTADGIYAIALTSTAALAKVRAQGVDAATPFAYLRTDQSDAGSTVFKLPHAQAQGFDCANDRTVAVIDADTIHVYDISGFLAGSGSLPVLSTRPIALNFPETGAIDVPDVSAGTVTYPSPFTLAIALRANGHVEYRIDPATPSISLLRHRIPERNDDILFGSGFFRESVLLTHVAHNETLFVVEGDATVVALIGVDNTNTTGSVTENSQYDPGDNCASDAAFTGRTMCRLGGALRGMKVIDADREIWFRDDMALVQHDREANEFRTHGVPVAPSSLVLRDETFWVFAGRHLHTFSRADVESPLPTGVQSPPLQTINLDLFAHDVLPREEAAEHLVVSSGEIGWLDGDSPALLATQSLNVGIDDAAFDPQNRVALIVDTTPGFAHIYQRSGGSAALLHKSEEDGYVAAAGCVGGVYALRAQGNKRLIDQFQGGGMATFVETASESFSAIACNATHLFMTSGPLNKIAYVTVYDRATGEEVSTFNLPLKANKQIDRFVLTAVDDWLGVQVQTRGSYYYKLSDIDNPPLIASDFFAQVAQGTHFSLLSLGDALRYGVLVDQESRTPTVLIKKAEP